MKTLKEFQDTVLRPLREERDRQLMAIDKQEAAAKTACSAVKTQIEEERRELIDSHNAGFLAVRQQMAKERKLVEQAWQKRRTQACAEYNRERQAKGEPTLRFDYAMRIITEVEKEANADAQ